MGRALALLVVVAGIALLGRPAGAQSLVLQEAVIGAGGQTTAAEGRTTTTALGTAVAGRAAAGTIVLQSGFPSPLGGRAVLRIEHRLAGDGAPRPAGEPVPVQVLVRAAPGTDVAAIRLFYRTGADEATTGVDMSATDDGFEAVIPGAAVGPNGVAYYFRAEAGDGTVVRAPQAGVFSFGVSVGGDGIARAETQPTGSDQAAYRLISVPLDLEANRVQDVFGDDIPALASPSAYDRSKARLFEFDSDDASFFEFPNTARVTVGRAFWLIVAPDAQEEPIDTGPGTARALDAPYEIPLVDGWNYVGTPFPFSVPIENVRRAGSDAPVVVRRYDDDGYNTPDNPVGVLEPFEGYAVFSDGDGTLEIDPRRPADDATGAAGSRSAGPVAEAAEAGTGAAGPEGTETAARGWAPEWALRLVGTAEGQATALVAGAASAARPEADALDWPAPPVPGPAALYFERPEWGGPAARYSSDVRPPSPRGQTWSFTVDVGAGAAGGPPAIRLAATGAESVPDGVEVRLLDMHTLFSQDLRQEAVYRFRPDAPGPREMRLIAGPRGYVERELEHAGARPTEVVVDGPYPNPAVGRAHLRVGVPDDAPVTMEVYNLLGQRLAVVRSERPMSGGYHRLSWNGTRAGRPVASGMYFLRVRVGETVVTKKLTVVR
jgi:hypothetical protein